MTTETRSNMAYLNDNYLKLKAGYLFPEIARRVKAFCEANPEAAKRLIRCGIGDVTEFLPTNARDPLSEAARATDEYRRFARWSRFPYFIPAPDGDSTGVVVGDARYARGSDDSWAGVRIRMAPPP